MEHEDPAMQAAPLSNFSYVDAQLAATELSEDDLRLVESHQAHIAQSRQVGARLSRQVCSSVRPPTNDSRLLTLRNVENRFTVRGCLLALHAYWAHRLSSQSRSYLADCSGGIRALLPVVQTAIASLGERPADEAAAQAWDVNAHALDAQAEEAAAQQFADEPTQAAWARWVHREQLKALRNQLAASEVVGQYAGARHTQASQPWTVSPPLVDNVYLLAYFAR